MASPDCKVQKVGAVWQFEGDGSPGGGVGENGSPGISPLKVAGKMIFLFHRWDMYGYVSSQEGKYSNQKTHPVLRTVSL